MRTTLTCALAAVAVTVAACGGGDDNKDEGSKSASPAPAAVTAMTVELEGQKAQFNIPSDHRPKPSPSQEAAVTFVPPGCGGGSAKLTVFTTKVVSTPDQIVELIESGETNVEVSDPVRDPKPVLGDGGEAATVAHFRVPGYDAVTSVAVVQAEPKVYPAIVMTRDVKPGCDVDRIVAEHEKVLEAAKLPFSG